MIDAVAKWDRRSTLFDEVVGSSPAKEKKKKKIDEFANKSPVRILVFGACLNVVGLVAVCVGAAQAVRVSACSRGPEDLEPIMPMFLGRGLGADRADHRLGCQGEFVPAHIAFFADGGSRYAPNGQAPVSPLCPKLATSRGLWIRLPPWDDLEYSGLG